MRVLEGNSEKTIKQLWTKWMYGLCNEVTYYANYQFWLNFDRIFKFIGTPEGHFNSVLDLKIFTPAGIWTPTSNLLIWHTNHYTMEISELIKNTFSLNQGYFDVVLLNAHMPCLLFVVWRAVNSRKGDGEGERARLVPCMRRSILASNPINNRRFSMNALCLLVEREKV